MAVIKKSTSLALIQFVFVFAFCSMATGDGSFAKWYPLPITELEAVVSAWLLESGFEVKHTSPGRGQVDINALRGQESWQLSLVAHSPLATKITAKTENGGQADPLWNHLRQYLRGVSSHSPKEINPATTPATILSRVESVVCIRTTGKGQSIQFSGFAISGGGAILCTAHDLKNHSRVTVMLNDGREVEGQVVKLDAFRDLAMVQVETRLDPFVDLHSGRNRLEENEPLFSVGCPMSVPGVIQSGALHGAPRRLNGLPLWQVDMEMHPGSSGSPVFDAAGNLVAMIKGRYRGTDSLGFLIPFEILRDFVAEN